MALRNAPSTLLARIGGIAERLSSSMPAVADTALPAEQLAARVRAALPAGATVDGFTVGAEPLSWFDTGLQLQRGQSVTVICVGTVHLVRALKLSLMPKSVAWWRVGDADIQSAPGESWSFQATTDGTLKFAALPPGSFSDTHGTIERSPLHTLMSGGLSMAVIRWNGPVEAGLRTAAERDAGLFAAALRRYLSPVQPPADWHYLWRVGQGELYHAEQDTLHCDTDCDVGILQFPVDVPLTEGLHLQWRWRAEQLPSQRAEHIDITHDYLSIAVEFDNGLDLTYMWSAALKPGTVFQCPLPWWKERETHWVVRALPGDPLGQWLDESQPLHANYGTAIGDRRPRRVVAVWLIANSLFQRRQGRCAYRDINLVDGDKVTPIVITPPEATS